MKWFIKCVKQYADFSGRARRKEYWMFVLFNIIFAFVWTFLLILALNAFNSNIGDSKLVLATNIASFSYCAALLLPGMAVAVRRLHDVGKSGWMLLAGLIPLIGAIWLLVLMVTEGEQGENKYGANPKTSPETFSESAKLRSAGVALTVASFVRLISYIYSAILFKFGIAQYLSGSRYFIISTVLLLMSGIYLLNGKAIYEIRGKVKYAFIVLLIAVSISFLSGVMSITTIIEHFGWEVVVLNLLNIFGNLLLAMFAVFVLFLHQNKNIIRNVAVLSIILTGLSLVLTVYYHLALIVQIDNVTAGIGNPFSIFSVVLVPVACIVLMSAFLTKKGLSEAKETPQTTDSYNSFNPKSNKGILVETSEQSLAYWMMRLSKPDKERDPFVYYIFTNEHDARKALLELPFISRDEYTGKLICDEVFYFGCYQSTNNGQPTGEYDAFVAGMDLTVEMWQNLHNAFTKYGGRKKDDRKPDENVKKVSGTDGNARNAVFVREDRNSMGTYLTYRAPSKADAMAFLSTQRITLPSYYVVVETPDGNYGKDIQGIYKE